LSAGNPLSTSIPETTCMATGLCSYYIDECEALWGSAQPHAHAQHEIRLNCSNTQHTCVRAHTQTWFCHVPASEGFAQRLKSLPLYSQSDVDDR